MGQVIQWPKAMIPGRSREERAAAEAAEVITSGWEAMRATLAHERNALYLVEALNDAEALERALVGLGVKVHGRQDS